MAEKNVTLTEDDCFLLVELACKEQCVMLQQNYNNYDTDKYKQLENLKVKLKS